MTGFRQRDQTWCRNNHGPWLGIRVSREGSFSPQTVRLRQRPRLSHVDQAIMDNMPQGFPNEELRCALKAQGRQVSDNDTPPGLTTWLFEVYT